MRPDLGIAGMAVKLGEAADVATTAKDYVPDPERVIRWGYRTFHRAPDGVTATDLAAAAARDALAAADCSAKDLDLIVLASSDVPEFLHWDGSAALARALGARDTPTLMLTQGCASGVTAFGDIAGAMALRESVDTALLVTVGRVDETYRNRMQINNCLFSDGAAAAVLRRGHERLRWLSTEQLTDGDFCEFFQVGHDSTAEAELGTLERIQRHFNRDPRQLKQFIDQINDRMACVIDRACAGAGVRRDQLSRVIYLNDNQQALADLSRVLGIPLDRTNAELASRYGHVAGADQLICLRDHVARGELAEGDLVALAGVSLGMHWFCTLIQV
jgi:3-oxoacyl-[acyl-carrier-protein] synthase-3